MSLIIFIFIQIIASSLGNDEYITVLNIYPVNNSDQIFQCYTPSTFHDYRLSYGRSFNISNADNTSETLWNRRSDHRYLTEEWNMGVYYCKIVIGDKTTIVQTTKIRSDAAITPANSKNSITVNIGDDVTISFDADPDWDVYWRKDDELLSDEITKVKSMTFNKVKITDTGMYEVYKEGQRSARNHSFINLIVRACPRHKWGPPECKGDCDYCYNGGVCNENTGICICAPGFTGATCNIQCGGNKHGWKCEQHCTRHNRIEACKHFQFCLPDPYGCSCVTGFKGLDCNIKCEAGKFGANCAQSCHCNQGECDRFTGNCIDTQNSSCAHPWTGSNCQECQQPYYGENCELKCTKSCECHRITGDCIGGKCYTNAWLEPHCEIGIINTTFSSVNNGQNTDVYCTVFDGGVENVKSIVMVTNNNITENITASLSIEDGQGIMKYKFLVISDIDSTYKCVIVQEGILAQSDIVPNIYRLPSYNGYIKTVNSSSSAITIEWTAWNSEADNGDGPITGYYVYYKMNSTDNWENKQYHKALKKTVTGLLQDTTYTFALSAVRRGEGGEGPIGKQQLTITTLCGLCSISDIFSTSVITGFGAGFGLMVFIDIIIFIAHKQRKSKKDKKSTDSVYQAATESKEKEYDELNLYENTRKPTDGATKTINCYENNSVIGNTMKSNPGVVASNEEQYDELKNQSENKLYECIM